MRLSRLTVKQLFGVFSYDFSIKDDQEIALLTGPNGYGKTTLLNILSELSQANFIFFVTLPFESIFLEFTNGASICITSEEENHGELVKEEDNRANKARKITFNWSQGDALLSSFVLAESELLAYLSRHPYFRYNRRGKERKVEDNPYREIDFAKAEYPDLISKFIEEIGGSTFLMALHSLSVKFQPSDRLRNVCMINYKGVEQDRIPSIKEISGELSSLMSTLKEKFQSQVSDSNNHLVQKVLDNSPKLEAEAYQEISNRLQEPLKQLREFKLLPDVEIPQYVDSHAKLLTVYIQELEKNLEVYAEIYTCLLLFKKQLEKKRFVQKKILLDPVKGIVVQNTQNYTYLSLETLSSGEQHEIIMLFRSIFGVKKKTILLIDEPENSLHVVWQNEFLEDIQELARTLELQVIIATHSPFIVGERWSECYDLFEASNGAE